MVAKAPNTNYIYQMFGNLKADWGGDYTICTQVMSLDGPCESGGKREIDRERERVRPSAAPPPVSAAPVERFKFDDHFDHHFDHQLDNKIIVSADSPSVNCAYRAERISRLRLASGF